MKRYHSYNSFYDISLSDHTVCNLLHFALTAAADHLFFTHLSAPFPFSYILFSLKSIFTEKQQTLKNLHVLVEYYFFYCEYELTISQDAVEINPRKFISSMISNHSEMKKSCTTVGTGSFIGRELFGFSPIEDCMSFLFVNIDQPRNPALTHPLVPYFGLYT